MKHLIALVLICLALTACNQHSLENENQPLLDDEVGQYYVVTNLEITNGAHPHAAAEVRGYPATKQMRMVETVSHNDALFTLEFGETARTTTKGSAPVTLDDTACLRLDHDGDTYSSCKDVSELSPQHAFGYSRTTGNITTSYECNSPSNECCRPRYSQPVYWSEYQPTSSSQYHTHTKVSGSYTKTWKGSWSGNCVALQNGSGVCLRKDS